MLDLKSKLELRFNELNGSKTTSKKDKKVLNDSNYLVIKYGVVSYYPNITF